MEKWILLNSQLPKDILNDHGDTPINPLGNVFTAITDSNVWVKAINTGATALAVIFLVSFLVMIMAATFKHGQWKKFAQGTAVATLIGTICLRAFPFIILSVPSLEQTDYFMNLVLLLLLQCILFVALIGIAVGLLLRFGYRLIEHPDFYKSYRTVITVSIVVVVFSVIVPSILV